MFPMFHARFFVSYDVSIHQQTGNIFFAVLLRFCNGNYYTEKHCWEGEEASSKLAIIIVSDHSSCFHSKKNGVSKTFPVCDIWKHYRKLAIESHMKYRKKFLKNFQEFCSFLCFCFMPDFIASFL